MTTTRGPGRPRGLLAYPAQSNFTGVQHPLHWIELGHERGYDVLRRDRAPPGPAADVIHERVRRLSEHLLSGLTGLRHGNGAPMVRIYGPTDVRDRGGTVSLNVLEPQGVLVDERLVAAESAAQGVSLRTGCFCNPGAGEGAFDLTRGQLKRSRGWGVQTIDDYLLRLDLLTGGAVRVSLGIASNLADVERFLDFLRTTYRDRPAATEGLEPRLRC